MKKVLVLTLALAMTLCSIAFAQGTEEPLEMTMWYRGSFAETMPGAVKYFEEICLEKYNVDLTVECIDKGAVSEKVNVTLAAQDYPDIMCGLNTTLLKEGAENGVFLPLNDAIDAHPNWSTLDKKTYFNAATFDGLIYGTPSVFTSPHGLYIRQDWLDNLNIPMPTNPDELAEVMLAFTTQDPDGNGVDDTYGLVMDSALSCTPAIQYMFLPSTWFGFYIDEEAGEIKNTAYLEEDMKDLLSWFVDIYANGAFDPEWVVTSDADAQAKFNTGLGGVYARGIMFIMNYYNKIVAGNPDGKIAAMPPYSRYGTNLKADNKFFSGYALTKACKDPARGAQVLLSLYDTEGIMAFTYGRPGETYELDEDGNFSWLSDEARTMFNPGMIMSCCFDTPLYTDEPVLEVIKRDFVPDFEFYDFVTLSMITAESEEYTAKAADLGTMATEFRTKIIMGELTLENDWDAFFSDFKALCDPVLAELNDIYQAG